jgi:2'-5' RNA ligase
MESTSLIARIFVGVPVDAQNVTTMVREHPLLADLPVRWIRDEDLHITILAPWNTSTVDAAVEKFTHLPQRSAFPLFFHTVETVPRSIPRVLWVQSHPSYSIITLKQDLERLFGVVTENRPFLPHITLARFIDGRQSNYVNPIHEPFSWAVSVDRVALYQSHTSSNGAYYEQLAVKTFDPPPTL